MIIGVYQGAPVFTLYPAAIRDAMVFLCCSYILLDSLWLISVDCLTAPIRMRNFLLSQQRKYKFLFAANEGEGPTAC